MVSDKLSGVERDRVVGFLTNLNSHSLERDLEKLAFSSSSDKNKQYAFINLTLAVAPICAQLGINWDKNHYRIISLIASTDEKLATKYRKEGLEAASQIAGHVNGAADLVRSMLKLTKKTESDFLLVINKGIEVANKIAKRNENEASRLLLDLAEATKADSTLYKQVVAESIKIISEFRKNSRGAAPFLIEQIYRLGQSNKDALCLNDQFAKAYDLSKGEESIWFIAAPNEDALLVVSGTHSWTLSELEEKTIKGGDGFKDAVLAEASAIAKAFKHSITPEQAAKEIEALTGRKYSIWKLDSPKAAR